MRDRRRLRRVAYTCLGLAVAAAGGCGGIPSFLVTPVQSSTALEETDVAPGRGLFQDKVAVIPVEGLLANAAAGGLLSAGENPVSAFVEELDRAAADDGVKAVVLRVNSPGGTVSASDAMYLILKRFKARTHKPVVASVQEVGASGAYYVACGADKIVAQPTSLVGSIGVIFETFDVEGTLNKLGVQSNAYKSAEHKDIGSPFRPATPEEKAIFQGLVDEYFARFKSVVTDNRAIPDPSRFPTMTDGRVFSGERARTLGLVDKTGLLSDAIDLARDLAHAPDAKVVAYKHSYADTGSIYAVGRVPAPAAAAGGPAGTPAVLKLQLPDAATLLPPGFYYLWRP